MGRPKKIHNPIDALLNPPHLSQKCGAKARSTGLACKRWAALGSHRCKFHGGGKGSGRPKIHGKRSQSHIRQANVMSALVKVLRVI
jgi:hypothetical protein